jgi:ATP-dependent DNA helicase Rep
MSNSHSSDGLNLPQRAAVKYLDGPLLVLAGAGSGKTRVITHKIAYLIEKAETPARHIAAVTFTNKAAREMKARVSAMLDSRLTRGLTVSTFHSLGLDIIRKELKALGYKAGFSIFDPQDSAGVLRSLADKHGTFDNETLDALLAQISRWKNTLVSPEQAMLNADASDKLAQQAAHWYVQYQRQLQAYNAVDFDDLIRLPVDLFETDAAALERWQNKIRYLLVDEYQDTNAAQYALVKRLTGVRGSLTVVGDDDQSIYAWRGAQPENLALLAQDFPRLNVIKLEQNYRSSNNILSAANELIKNNPHVFEKKLWSDKGTGDRLRILYCKDEHHEAERVISELMAHQFQSRGNYADYAILYRGNHQSRLFEQHLRAHRIPYFLSGGTSFFSRAEIKDIMAYLRLIINPDDDAAFLRIINTPRREIGTSTLEKLGNYAKERSTSLFTASFEMGLLAHLSERALERLQNFVNWVVAINDRAERGEECAPLVREVIETIGYENWLKDTCNDIKTAERRMANVQELVEWIRKLAEESADSKTLKEIVAHISLLDILDRQAEDQPQDRVALMTLHAAKGLEFPHVFLVGVEEDLLPHANSQADEHGIQEERRLLYVGITRAQKTLTMSLAGSRKRFGEQGSRNPSRFLQELPPQLLVWEGRPQDPICPQAKQERGKAHLANLKGLLR